MLVRCSRRLGRYVLAPRMCTRPVKEGEDPRAGRWWWETGAPKECGMHCSIETGGFEHELAALLGNNGNNGSPQGGNG